MSENQTETPLPRRLTMSVPAASTARPCLCRWPDPISEHSDVEDYVADIECQSCRWGAADIVNRWPCLPSAGGQDYVRQCCATQQAICSFSIDGTRMTGSACISLLGVAVRGIVAGRSRCLTLLAKDHSSAAEFPRPFPLWSAPGYVDLIVNEDVRDILSVPPSSHR